MGFDDTYPYILGFTGIIIILNVLFTFLYTEKIIRYNPKSFNDVSEKNIKKRSTYIGLITAFIIISVVLLIVLYLYVDGVHKNKIIIKIAIGINMFSIVFTIFYLGISLINFYNTYKGYYDVDYLNINHLRKQKNNGIGIIVFGFILMVFFGIYINKLKNV